MLKTQLKFIVTIALVLGLSISFQSLVASWQAPSANPPNPNIDKPINISSDFQEKTGSFSVGGTLGVGIGLNSLGQIAIKNNSPQIKFDDDSGDGYWIHNNSGRLYFLWDESDDGDWDGPHPLYLQGRDAVFGGRARTTRTVLNGDPGDTIATKKYVDDNGGGGADFVSGSHCGLNVSGLDGGNGTVNCLGHNPRISCPTGFTKLGGDYQSPGNRYWYSCIKN